MRNAMAVGDDQRGAGIGFGFDERPERMLVFGAHGHAGHIDRPVAHGDKAEVFLAQRLAAGGKFGNRAARRSFRALTTGVGINLGVQHQHINIVAARQDVVQTPVADIVRPAVAADDPNTAADEIVGHGKQHFGVTAGVAGQFLFKGGDALPLVVNARLVSLLGLNQPGNEVVAQFRRQFAQQLAGKLPLLVNRNPEAKPELGIILEQGIVPGWTAAFLVFRVGSGGQVAAVDGRASRGVAGHNAIPEKLRKQLQVRRLAAAAASAAILKERLHDLLLAELGDLDLPAVKLRQFEEEFVVVALAETDGRLRAHIDRLEPGLGLVLGRADLDAQAAAGAIFRGDLQGPFHAFPFRSPGVCALKGRRRALQMLGVVNLHADAGVRADYHALAALDAGFLIPNRDFQSQIPFLIAGSAGGEGAIRAEGTDREGIAAVAINNA